MRRLYWPLSCVLESPQLVIAMDTMRVYRAAQCSCLDNWDCSAVFPMTRPNGVYGVVRARARVRVCVCVFVLAGPLLARCVAGSIALYLKLCCSLSMTISSCALNVLLPGATGVVDDVLRTGMVAVFSGTPLYPVRVAAAVLSCFSAPVSRVYFVLVLVFPLSIMVDFI